MFALREKLRFSLLKNRDFVLNANALNISTVIGHDGWVMNSPLIFKRLTKNYDIMAYLYPNSQSFPKFVFFRQ